MARLRHAAMTSRQYNAGRGRADLVPLGMGVGAVIVTALAVLGGVTVFQALCALVQGPGG
ncbi:hypothetical protein ACX4MT_20135 [Roseomonas mucosa]